MGWDGYVDRFHAERPGITERILSRCRADDLDPYTWLVEAVDGVERPVVDVACGSAPTADRLTHWVGIDRSTAELGAARAGGRAPLVQASAERLPVASGHVGAAVCAMALQVIEPLRSALGELARVVEPGGRVAALVPASSPLPWRDAAAYLRLQVALRARISYPNDRLLGGAALGALAASVGLSVASDERRAFVLPLPTEADVDDLLRSLYLPAVATTRIEAGRNVLMGRVGGSLTVPLRRLVLIRSGDSDA